MGEKVRGWNGFAYMLDRDMRIIRKHLVKSRFKIQDVDIKNKEI